MKIKRVKVKDSSSWKSRVYFFPSESIMENLEKRRSRPYNEYRKLLPQVFKKAGIAVNTKAAWRQSAGCACGCSPGFILDNKDGVEIFVDIT